MMMQRRILTKIFQSNPLHHYHSFRTLAQIAITNQTLTNLTQQQNEDDENNLHSYSDIPKPPRTKSERKPYPTPMKTLIRKAKKEKQARMLQPCRLLENPPDNGLLVRNLVHVAHRVYRARESLLLGLEKLIRAVPVKRCRYCFEVHIGKEGHEIRTCTGPKSGLRSATHVWRKGRVSDLVYFPKSFHLYDRAIKPRVLHDERRSVPQIPAMVELCIQAGLELEKYPTKRRTKPVYSIEGRIVDFESVTAENNEIQRKLTSENVMVKSDVDDEIEKILYSQNVSAKREENDETGGNLYVDNVNVESESEDGICSNLLSRNILVKGEENLPISLNVSVDNLLTQSNDDEDKRLKHLSIKTLDSWLEMVTGAKEIMKKYNVQTCGYCPEIQVGPKGHKVRMCKGTKHQSRNGLHAWQEATIDDLVGPNYVWHVKDLNNSALNNNLKRYYGKSPAIVELCVQAGAPVPAQYRSMMRLDVVPPDRDEVDLVA